MSGSLRRFGGGLAPCGPQRPIAHQTARRLEGFVCAKRNASCRRPALRLFARVSLGLKSLTLQTWDKEKTENLQNLSWSEAFIPNKLITGEGSTLLWHRAAAPNMSSKIMNSFRKVAKSTSKRKKNQQKNVIPRLFCGRRFVEPLRGRRGTLFASVRVGSSSAHFLPPPFSKYDWLFSNAGLVSWYVHDHTGTSRNHLTERKVLFSLPDVQFTRSLIFLFYFCWCWSRATLAPSPSTWYWRFSGCHSPLEYERTCPLMSPLHLELVDRFWWRDQNLVSSSVLLRLSSDLSSFQFWWSNVFRRHTKWELNPDQFNSG